MAKAGTWTAAVAAMVLAQTTGTAAAASGSASQPAPAMSGAPGHQSNSPGYILTDLKRSIGLTSYLAKLSVGTPPQEQYLLVDSGSPMYAFLSPANKVCSEPGKPCAYGTYDNTSSSTSRYENEGFQDILIDHGYGSYLQDTVSIGGTPFTGEFGYITAYGGTLSEVARPTTTIMGLSLFCQLAVGPNCTPSGASLIQQLRNSSIIDRRAFSLYLGPDEPQSHGAQLLLGGAVDQAKMLTPPFTVPMADPSTQPEANGQTNSVNVTRISVLNIPRTLQLNTTTANGLARNGNRLNAVFGQPGVGTPSLVDSGNAVWRLPSNVWDVLHAWLGRPATQDQLRGYYLVDCALKRNMTKMAESQAPYLEVEFAGRSTGSNNTIKIPFPRLITDFGDGTCATFTAPGPAPINGLAPFGDAFLRSAYVTFDYDNMTISMAQIKYTDETNIVRLGSS